MGATNCEQNFGIRRNRTSCWKSSQTIDGITKACEELEIPITGGNVSFDNETLGEEIYPTPVLVVVGILEIFRGLLKCILRGQDARLCSCTLAKPVT